MKEAIYINPHGNIITFRPDDIFTGRFTRSSHKMQEYTYTPQQAIGYLVYWEYELIGYV